MASKKRNTQEPPSNKQTYSDRIIWSVLTPIIEPLINIYELLYPEYEEVTRTIHKNELCYCDSGKKYSKCHLNQHKEKGKIAVKITRTYRKSRRTKIKYSVRSIEKKIKPGSINPLNSKGRYFGTGEYQSE